MAYTLEILIILIGIIYGYMKPGKEDRSTLLKKGVVIGIILGVIMVVLGLIGGRGILLLGSLVGAIVFIEVIILAILFIIGTYIGDMLEGNR
jgi:amino acid transporter